MSKSFGEKLKELRIEKKMSQEELAAFLGTSKQVVSRYETNQRTPKITIAQEYADKLKVPLSYLIDNSEVSIKGKPDIPEDAGLNPLISEAVDILNSLPPELQKVALEQLDSLSKISKMKDN